MASIPQSENHGMPRLALAILTSPGAAFEEIIRRSRPLGSRPLLTSESRPGAPTSYQSIQVSGPHWGLGGALVITALTGAAACVASLLVVRVSGPVEIFALGKANPLAWLGLCLLYGLALQLIVRWSRADVDFPTALTVLGWSQVTLLVSELLFIAGLVVAASAHPNLMAANLLVKSGYAVQLYYVIVVGTGIRRATNLTLPRSVAAYALVEGVALVADVLYGKSRFEPFANALPGVQVLASSLVAADQTPWVAGAAVGLALGLRELGRCLEWDSRRRQVATVIGGLLGAAGVIFYLAVLQSGGYYASLLGAQRFYDRGHYEDAAVRLARLLPASIGNAPLLLDIGNAYYAGGSLDPRSTTTTSSSPPSGPRISKKTRATSWPRLTVELAPPMISRANTTLPSLSFVKPPRHGRNMPTHG